MAIKYGRPIEARLAPVETRPVKRLDLTTRPRRNRKSEWARRMPGEMAVPPPIDNAARRHQPRSRGAGGPFVERLKRATKT